MWGQNEQGPTDWTVFALQIPPPHPIRLCNCVVWQDRIYELAMVTVSSTIRPSMKPRPETYERIVLVNRFEFVGWVGVGTDCAGVQLAVFALKKHHQRGSVSMWYGRHCEPLITNRRCVIHIGAVSDASLTRWDMCCSGGESSSNSKT